MKKIMTILVLIMLVLLGMSSVCASDANDALAASEDDLGTELVSMENNLKITQDNNAADDGEILSASNDDEIITAEKDFDELSSNPSYFSTLSREIGYGGDIELKHDYYRYDWGSGILIKFPGVINGNGAVIDMSESHIQPFYVVAYGVTIKNLTIKNVNCDKGSSISGGGGAIYFSNNGGPATIENCNFINVNSLYHGGAIYYEGTSSEAGLTVKNCNFVNSRVTFGGCDGGAIYMSNGISCTVKNCNFTNCSAADTGGAVYFGSRCNSPVVEYCNFCNNSAYCGGAVSFDWVYGGSVKNCNLAHNSASGRGGAVQFYSGSIENCNLSHNSASNGGAVCFLNDGNAIGCDFANNSASDGGALYFSTHITGNVERCNFCSNSAYCGGGLYFAQSSTGRVKNSNFTDNSAYIGGAAYFEFNAEIANSNFIGNNATSGSAVYLDGRGSFTKKISNSCFLDNRANADDNDPFKVTQKENTIEITFIGRNNLLNAIYSVEDVELNNVTYWGMNGPANTDDVHPCRTTNEAGQNIFVTAFINDCLVLNEIRITNDEGKIILDDAAGSYLIFLRHDADFYYTDAQAVKTNL